MANKNYVSGRGFEYRVVKQNTLGRVKLKLVLRKRVDWQQQLEDTKLRVVTLLTKVES